jgi:hypothetical protein
MESHIFATSPAEFYMTSEVQQNRPVDTRVESIIDALKQSQVIRAMKILQPRATTEVLIGEAKKHQENWGREKKGIGVEEKVLWIETAIMENGVPTAGQHHIIQWIARARSGVLSIITTQKMVETRGEKIHADTVGPVGIDKIRVLLESMLIQLACVGRKWIEFEVKGGEKALGVVI